MNVTGRFEREKALRDGTVPFRSKSQLLVEGGRGEQVEHAVADFVVERGVDTVPYENGKSDFLQSACKGRCKLRPRVGAAVKELPEIERRDLVIVVELVGGVLRQAIGVCLAHLIVAAELLVERIRIHQAVFLRSAPSGASSARSAKLCSQCSPI